jgi:hypothetical protein
MNLWEMIGITPQQGLTVGGGAAAVILFIGLRLWWRGRTDQRVRINLSDRQ